jgi:hypothetical protein
MAKEYRICVHQFRDQQFGSLSLRALQPRGDSLKSLWIPKCCCACVVLDAAPSATNGQGSCPQRDQRGPSIPAALSEASQPRSLASNRIRLTVEQACELAGPKAIQRTAPGTPLL